MGKIIDLKDKLDINKNDLKEVTDCIRNGGVVIFPTETVYGIGANALNKEAVDKIFIAKGRPQDNPLIVHISDYSMLEDIVKIDKINSTEKSLMEAFWPGPFTIILPKKDILPDNVTAGLNTVGVRMPDNNIALEIIEAAGVPIAAPSANVSGKPSGTRIQDILDELSDKVDYIIDSGNSSIGIESTVVKVVGNKVKILRPGKVSKQDIEKVAENGNVEIDQKVFEKSSIDEKVESPGMKHRHYAPKCNCILVYSNDESKMIDRINNISVENVDNDADKICILGFLEHEIKLTEKLSQNIIFINLGSIDELNQISKNIFSALRQVDKLNCKLCIIEGVKKEGIGLGIMNRLIRACEYNYIEIDDTNK